MYMWSKKRWNNLSGQLSFVWNETDVLGQRPFIRTLVPSRSSFHFRVLMKGVCRSKVMRHMSGRHSVSGLVGTAKRNREVQGMSATRGGRGETETDGGGENSRQIEPGWQQENKKSQMEKASFQRMCALFVTVIASFQMHVISTPFSSLLQTGLSFALSTATMRPNTNYKNSTTYTPRKFMEPNAINSISGNPYPMFPSHSGSLYLCSALPSLPPLPSSTHHFPPPSTSSYPIPPPHFYFLAIIPTRLPSLLKLKKNN